MPIEKSKGVTPTERLLADLCEQTFLKLWSYPNPFKEDGKELCDVIAVFEDRVFIFFDRESRKFDRADKDVLVNWDRWCKEAIDKQISTALGAGRYIKKGRRVFLDQAATVPFPFDIPAPVRVYKIIVAHGAKEACEAFSDANVTGSLAIAYGDSERATFPFPFFVSLDRADPVHVFDSSNLEIVFSEIDTVSDFVFYLDEKERAIRHYDHLSYCGEEDLLAHYFLNFDTNRQTYTIGSSEPDINGVFICEGEWQSFIDMEPYKRRKDANQVSYLWDDIIQRTSQNALDGTLFGDADAVKGKTAIHEMAKEPRFQRRALSQAMFNAIEAFPESAGSPARNLSFMPSFDDTKGYVFLQVRQDYPGDYENEYRPFRRMMLEVACGAARNKFHHLKKIVGIAIDAPKFTNKNSEDFILLECDIWTEEQRAHYTEENKLFNFFRTKKLKMRKQRMSDFPRVPAQAGLGRKIGRNEPCPCGSGKKFKKCCRLA